MRQQMHAPCVCATQKPKVQAKGPKWLSERQTATRVPKKKGQNDVGSEINEKIIIVTPASEMWQEGGSKTPPQNRISLGIQVSICHPTKRSGKHQSSEKRKARPRMTKRRRTGKPKKSFPTHNSRHRLRTLAERMTPRWKLCVGMRVCKCAFGSLMEGGKPPNEGKSPNRICCKGWCYPTVSCGVGKSPSQSFLLRREADNIILR